LETEEDMIRPQTELELAEIVAGTSVPLVIQGAGTKGTLVAGERLSVAGLSGVELYEPGALTLVVQAGTPLAEIEAVLAGENQRLAFEPMDYCRLLGRTGAPTIGGVVAANVSGPRRIQAGACRDFLLGVRFVDGQGTLIKNGGRVMKNVTGYDLVKLMSGSWGTLGVLSQVSLKVLPMAETQATVMASGLTTADAVRVMSAALGSPFEVTGAAYDPVGPDGTPVVMLRVEGFAASVEYRAGRLRDLLAQNGEITITKAAGHSDALWKAVRDVGAFQARPGDVWKLSVKPSDAPKIATSLDADGLLFDLGGGLIWALVPEGTDLRRRMGSFGGHATLVRASGENRARLGMFQPQPAALEAISAGLRARFDPKGILNSGLMQPPAKDQF
jgi:glycolate oxidase FAD binding subunit